MVNEETLTIVKATTTMMMPIVPATKRSNGFSIDSLMSRDSRKSPGPSATASRRTPESAPGSPPGGPRDSPSRSPPSSAGRDREARHSLGSVGGSPRSQAGDLSPRGPGGMTMGGIGSSFHPVHPGASLLNGLKGLYGSAGGGGHDHPHGFPEGLAGALGLHHPAHPAHAAAAAAGLHPHHPGLPGIPGVPPAAHGGLPPHPLLLGAQRDPFSMYPWLLSRQGGYFSHPRLLGPEASLLLQPFRKPKRIRTAFSPSQLLRLEHAFEKNHYVVGQERKDLASNLNLTETQVKVWFQNRRTKYKRMKQEEAESGEGGNREGVCDSPPHPEEDDDEILSDEEQLNVEDDDDDEQDAAIAHAHSQAMGSALHPLMYSHAVSMATANQLHYNAAAALQQQQQQQQQRNLRDNAENDRENIARNVSDEAVRENKESPQALRDSHIPPPEYKTKEPSSVPNGQTDSQKRPRSPEPQPHTKGATNPIDPQAKKPRLEFSLPQTHPNNHIERWQLAAAGQV